MIEGLRRAQLVGASGYRDLNLPYFEQKDSFWCGPACLSMVGRFYARSISQGEVADAVLRNRMSRTHDLARYVRTALGFRTKIRKNATIGDLCHLVRVGVPPIVLQQLRLGGELGHFRVVTNVRAHEVTTYDPMFGYGLRHSFEEFSALWKANSQTQDSGVLLSIAP